MEWFNFETKVRDFVNSIISPLAAQSDEIEKEQKKHRKPDQIQTLGNAYEDDEFSDGISEGESSEEEVSEDEYEEKFKNAKKDQEDQKKDKKNLDAFLLARMLNQNLEEKIID